MHSADFTESQLTAIATGVQHARDMLRKRGLNPLVFVEAMSELGSYHVPGSSAGTVVKRQIAQAVVDVLSGKVDEPPGHLSDEVRAAVFREVHRAYVETLWAGSIESPEVVGFRISLSSPVPASTRVYVHKWGMRPLDAIVPKTAIAILHPVADGATFEPVLEYQATYAPPPAKVTAVSAADLFVGLGRNRSKWGRGS